MSDWNVKVEAYACWVYILFSVSERSKKNASSFKTIAA